MAATAHDQRAVSLGGVGSVFFGPLELPSYDPSGRVLPAYLLESSDCSAVEPVLRRTIYEVSGGASPAILAFEPTPGITIGRDGSRTHVRPTPDKLAARGWAVRWVMRGGGAMLHLPGQIACYPVLRLCDLGLTPAAYVEELVRLAADLCASFGIAAEIDRERPGVRSRGRRVVSVGAAIRTGATGFGLYVNATPDLEPFREVDCDGDSVPMTSLLRESPSPIRTDAVRQRLIDLAATRFGFDRAAAVHQHPTFLPKPIRHAIPHRHR